MSWAPSLPPAQMARRRLRQIYRTTPFAAWAQQEKILGKRRDDRYLFAAITDPEVSALPPHVGACVVATT